MNNRKHLVLVILFIISCQAALGQSGTTEISLGGKKTDIGYSLVQSNNGGYAIAGITYSYGDTANGDMYVVKLDSAANIQWTRTIGGSKHDAGNSIVQLPNGDYVIAGSTRSYGSGGSDMYVVKLNSTGNIVWTKTFGGSGDDSATCIIKTYDGGFALTGSTTSYGAGGKDVYLVKLDSMGDLQWTKTIGGSLDDYGCCIIQTKDRGYAVAGSTSPYYNSYDMYIIKLDSSGNLQWDKTIDDGKGDVAYSIVQANDDDFIVCGNSQGLNIYTVKLDSAGNQVWASHIGTIAMMYGYSVIAENDGGCTIAGYQNFYTNISFGSYPCYAFMARVNSKGKTMWSNYLNNISGFNTGCAYSLIHTNDNGYAITGFLDSNYSYQNKLITTRSDILFCKLDSNGNNCSSATSAVGNDSTFGTPYNNGTLNVCLTDTGSGGLIDSGGVILSACSPPLGVNNETGQNFAVYPNPFHNYTTIVFNNPAKHYLEVDDVTGRKLQWIECSGKEYQLQKGSLAPGIYFIRMFDANKQYTSTQKIVVQ